MLYMIIYNIYYHIYIRYILYVYIYVMVKLIAFQKHRWTNAQAAIGRRTPPLFVTSSAAAGPLIRSLGQPWVVVFHKSVEVRASYNHQTIFGLQISYGNYVQYEYDLPMNLGGIQQQQRKGGWWPGNYWCPKHFALFKIHAIKINKLIQHHE
jgi:hypothetical protein